MDGSTHQRFGSGTDCGTPSTVCEIVKSPSSNLLAPKQTRMETMLVIQTRSVSGASQLKSLSLAVAHLGHGQVEIKRAQRGQHHQRLDGKHPDDELGAEQRRQGQRQRQKRDERHAGHAVGFKAVRRGPHRVAGVVAGAIGDDAGVFGIVFRQVEDDFHQVRADVGDLGEDAAADAQGAGAERFADGKADEAGPGQFRGNEDQDADHARQFHADQQQADAHAGLQAG